MFCMAGWTFKSATPQLGRPVGCLMAAVSLFDAVSRELASKATDTANGRAPFRQMADGFGGTMSTKSQQECRLSIPDAA